MTKNRRNWLHIVEDYFIMAKFQRRYVLVVLAAIVLLAIAPACYQFFAGTKTTKASAVLVGEETALKAVMAGEGYEKDRGRYDNNTVASHTDEKTAAAELFPFDPNTATVEEWVRLGVREKTAITIQNYLAKGGHFYKAEDLRKIYGFKNGEAERLIPYVRIAGKERKAFEKEAYATKGDNREPKPAYNNRPVDVNTADTTAFIMLPGIGSKLAARIVNYREKLGGFHNINQVAETYGLPDSSFRKIKPRLTISGTVRKININTASAAEMKMPYMPYNVVNAIIQHRLHHGPFQSVEGLKDIPLIDEPLFIKIAPYLTVE